MVYIELNCKVEPLLPFSEILIAELAEIGYESFVESENGIIAYIIKDNFRETDLSSLQITAFEGVNVEFSFKQIKDENWNAVWESNFEAVEISENCIVKAPFHNIEKKYKYEIIIEPKMSFGTAHHETTSQMMKFLLEMDLSGKTVLDMGCGTSVLAILASKLNAKEILAIDNDEWAYNNSIENIAKNNIHNIEVKLGDISDLKNKKFDIIIANINRNILLSHISQYSKSLNDEGLLLMSGFYEDDVEIIKKESELNGLKFDSMISENKWVAVKFLK
ncbi:MAG: 50S ribosomal protein L11 methyltransferase [Saprospiraceae bacterium]|nr:50S ribosomal protein L11 methyltransferase [Saprospiraceae bacterium]